MPLKYRNYEGDDYEEYVDFVAGVANMFVEASKADVSKEKVRKDAEAIVEFEKKFYEVIQRRIHCKQINNNKNLEKVGSRYIVPFFFLLHCVSLQLRDYMSGEEMTLEEFVNWYKNNVTESDADAKTIVRMVAAISRDFNVSIFNFLQWDIFISHLLHYLFIIYYFIFFN